MAGEVYDSGPVDFTSKQGVMALSSQKGGLMAWLVNSGVETVACTMDFFLVEWLEADRRRYWDTLRSSLVKGPALFLYSEADPFVDGERVRDLAMGLRLHGREVWEHAWKGSTHVAISRDHPEEYTKIVKEFLRHACQRWLKSSGQEGKWDWPLLKDGEAGHSAADNLFGDDSAVKMVPASGGPQQITWRRSRL
eukprot:evm.model.scf_480EXC.1 EVM.evm.TU.scf_480EXC.1   scf_480EXC:410-4263(+)